MSDGVEVDVDGEPATTLACDMLVNAAGVHAQAVARTLEGLPATSIPLQYLAKGQYYGLRGRSPFRRRRATAS